MKRGFWIGLLAAVLCLLCACGKMTNLHFTNHVGERIDSLYIVPVESDVWGDPINPYFAIANDSTVDISLAGLDEKPRLFDVGTIDINGRCCDVFDVPLVAGDSLDLGPEFEADGLSYVTLTVIHADQTEASYVGYAYFESELEEYLSGE